MGRIRVTDERGASAVEFAIIASLLLLILFGTITFGITFNRIQGLQSAAREGARLGSLTDTTVSQITTRVLESVSILNADNFKTAGPGGGTVRWCTAAGLTTFDTGCIGISTKQDIDKDGDYENNATELTPFTDDDDKPCEVFPAGSRKSLVVDVKYRISIDIPFWARLPMTAGGTGEFSCEQQG